MKKNQFIYFADKTTNGTIRFQPDEQAKQQIGQASIYLRKDWLAANGIKETDRILITIEKEQTNGYEAVSL